MARWVKEERKEQILPGPELRGPPAQVRESRLAEGQERQGDVGQWRELAGGKKTYTSSRECVETLQVRTLRMVAAEVEVWDKREHALIMGHRDRCWTPNQNRLCSLGRQRQKLSCLGRSDGQLA